MKKLLCALGVACLPIVACGPANYNTGEKWEDVFDSIFDKTDISEWYVGPQSEPIINRDQVDGDIAFINLTGGPSFYTDYNYFWPMFESNLFDYSVGGDNTNDYLTHSMNYIKQSQTIAYDSGLFGNEYNTSLELARKLNETTIKTIDNVAKSFKDNGKKVVLLGHSYGGLLGNQYLSTYGTENIDYAILAGQRLQFNKNLSTQLVNGGYGMYFKGFTNIVTPDETINMNCETPMVINVSSCTYYDDFKSAPSDAWIGYSDKMTNKEKWDAKNLTGIFLRLQGEATSWDYVKTLDEAKDKIEEDKVFYLWGENDGNVGKMSDVEEQFLVDNNYNTCKYNEGHNNDYCFDQTAKWFKDNIIKKHP